MPSAFDLRDEASLEGLLATADALIAKSDSLESLLNLEVLLSFRHEEWPLGAHIAVKLARSKCALRARRRALDLSVVFAVYGEHERMLRPDEHRLGEGFIDRKLRQLGWLVEGCPGARFDLWIVDDGCPYGSGALAQEILSQRHADAPARVLFLEDAIRDRHPMTEFMKSTSSSRKGGAIQLGLHEAINSRRPGQIALYTDADLSTHLGQAGLLVDALDRPGIELAAGSRRAATSVVVKGPSRSARGRLFIYLWKQLLPEIDYIHDTQCGFKAFRGSTLRRLLDQPVISDFAFDLELLLRSEHLRARSVAPVPIAWIDSEAASTTVALEPYLAMLQSAVDLHRRYESGGEMTEAFARAIESLSPSAWDRAISQLGPRLEAVDATCGVEAGRVEPGELEALVA